MIKIKVKNKKHTTEDEIYFIENIGQFHFSTKNIPKHILLKNYLNTCMQKNNWGDMDKFIVIGFIQKQLAIYS